MEEDKEEEEKRMKRQGRKGLSKSIKRKEKKRGGEYE